MENTDELLERIKNRDKKIEDFKQVLTSIHKNESKTKVLWLEIYENAVTDRENAYILFHEAYTTMMKSTAEHIATGPILNKYLERMNKANDQLLKLAELVAKAEENLTKIDPDDLFSQIKEN
ncbi:hypothetical protein CL634_08150 [bacterium]|nr:hypothetical protein [bacterium]|tara:strand:- start:992 stop:1357 length:366 start_codon:yes stop_codon:yes gene_type:complete